jgi:ATP-dependent Clp protease protease subunit
VVFVGGAVDPVKAGDVAATLMTLDALGDEPIELRLNAESDSIEAAFALIDTIDALGVPIHAWVSGALGGTMVGVLAVCQHRRMSAHARLHLREPRATFTGRASDLALHAGDYESRWSAFVRRLAESCRQPFEHVEADLRSGRFLDAASAQAYGLVDEVVDRGR